MDKVAAIQGEFTHSENDRGILLEVGAVTVNGKKIYATMNTVQRLLQVLANPNPATWVLDGKVPDVTYDPNKGLYQYLPRVVPRDYEKEVEVYRNAVKFVSVAA